MFFRPGVLTVSGRGSIQVCVQVPPDPLQKILKAPPDKLHRSSGETVVQRVTLYSKQACGSTGVTHKLPPQLGRCAATEPDLLIGFSGLLLSAAPMQSDGTSPTGRRSSACSGICSVLLFQLSRSSMWMARLSHSSTTSTSHPPISPSLWSKQMKHKNIH